MRRQIGRELTLIAVSLLLIGYLMSLGSRQVRVNMGLMVFIAISWVILSGLFYLTAFVQGKKEAMEEFDRSVIDNLEQASKTAQPIQPPAENVNFLGWVELLAYLDEEDDQKEKEKKGKEWVN